MMANTAIIAPAMFLWVKCPRQEPACSGSTGSSSVWIATSGMAMTPAHDSARQDATQMTSSARKRAAPSGNA